MKPWEVIGDTPERNERAKKAYTALLTVTAATPDNKEYRTFSDEVKRMAEENYNLTFNNESVSTFVTAFYDAVLLYSLALNETLNDGGSEMDGRAITKRMWNRTFKDSKDCLYLPYAGYVVYIWINRIPNLTGPVASMTSRCNENKEQNCWKNRCCHGDCDGLFASRFKRDSGFLYENRDVSRQIGNSGNPDTYGCEILTPTLREEQKLRVFENKVLRKIFGTKGDDVTEELRKLHNEELHVLYSSVNIIILHLKALQLHSSFNNNRINAHKSCVRTLACGHHATRTTINSDAYVATLKKLQARLSRVRLHREKQDVLLLHDNAQLYVSHKTTDQIRKFG
ncbi:hypothetical protein ANN_02714 [Periplaneta americana]|uniref:Receptor ligand binding region domain-containing protein n=1 Tax=Periplaneta americana TaxID=6978 RepID=A0ABQ8TY70_PERAM|nr:hypothetical protein ANN_02714 [Periplaneta americana]